MEGGIVAFLENLSPQEKRLLRSSLYVNNCCAHVGSVGFCVSSAPVVRSFLLRFFSHGVLLSSFHVHPCLRSFLRCDTLCALFRDCLATVILTTVTDITSTVGSGATVSTIDEKLRWSSVVKMTNRTVLAAYSTGSGLQQQQQEWWNQTPLPDEQVREPGWWNQTHVPSHHFEEQERSGRWPAPADVHGKFRSTPFNFPIRCRCS